MTYSCFIYSSTDGHLGCFHILTIANNAAMNIGVLTFFQINVLGFFGYIPKSGIAGSKGRSIFNFLRHLHTASHTGFSNLHILASKCCLFIDHSHLTGVKWYLIVVLISISLMISDNEHLFIHLFGHLCVLFGELSIQIPI